MSTREVLDTAPANHWHASVVVQVQEGDLSVLFSQHKKYCVQQFSQFGDEVHVESSRGLEKFLK